MSFGEFYSHRRWRTLRAAVLASHPLCSDPSRRHRREGLIPPPASEVHHIVPRSIDPRREMDLDNLAPVCAECHRDAEQLGRVARLLQGVADLPAGGQARAGGREETTDAS